MADEPIIDIQDGAGRIVRDDIVLLFRTVRSNVRGRIVRLGATADAILKRHGYPLAISEAVGEALALVAMLGTNLKTDGSILTVQAKTDGAVSLLVADYKTPGALRGCASFNAEALTRDDKAASRRVFGNGNLALTIDPGKGQERYQGIVSLDSQSLSDAAHTYFKQSEQLPTFLRLAVVRTYEPQTTEGEDGWSWRVGGLLVQHLSREGGHSAPPIADGEEELGLAGEEDDAWQRVRMLAETVEDHELVDPSLAAETLLYRLFHEEGVVTYDMVAMRDECRCSEDRVSSILDTLPDQDRAALADDTGKISVTCDFCSATYSFDP